MTLDYILQNIMYDMTIDNCTKYRGNIDYVTSHLADGNTSVMEISDNQPKDIADFVLKYKKANASNPNITIKDFYNTEYK